MDVVWLLHLHNDESQYAINANAHMPRGTQAQSDMEKKEKKKKLFDDF